MRKAWLTLILLFCLLHNSISISHQSFIACENAKHPDHCMSSIQELDLESDSNGCKKAMESAQVHLGQLLGSVQRSDGQDPSIRDCVELLEDALELVTDSISILEGKQNRLEDVHTWMSGAITYYTTCIDGLTHTERERLVLQHGDKVEKSLSTALALVASLHHGKVGNLNYGHLTKKIGNFSNSPNITVAQDGSGNFTTISQAIASTPTKSKSRFVIYIKAGTYFEYIEVPKIQNLVIVGDGIGKTIITGNKSVQDPNITTFTSPTFVVKANGIIIQDITFQNTAGAINHQAVAVRVTADQVSFFRCSFEGYQDTLYAHSLRQFYTQCDIYGTVDFIFGNAAAVFQNCNLYARLPMAKQKNIYTAQGRTDPNQNTGYSFQSCNIDGVQELRDNITSFPTYLGRPWKEYSLTVFLKCFETSVVDPAGWLEWSGDFALATLFYGEYFCYGPGGATEKRVNWSTQIYDSSFAKSYTATGLLSGGEWLPQTNLPYSLEL